MADREQKTVRSGLPQDATENGLALISPRSSSGFRRIKDVSSMVAELREGDGIDPRADRRERQRARQHNKPDYSAERLASQIERCINSSLGDGILAAFEVSRVSLSKGNNFVVTLRSSDPSMQYDIQEVQEAAKARIPILRAELAREIHRKKIPGLSICIAPRGEAVFS